MGHLPPFVVFQGFNVRSSMESARKSPNQRSFAPIF
jgi:hypothetical protein